MKTKKYTKFYTETIKNFEEHNIISFYLDELRDIVDRVSRTQVVGNRLEFIKKFPKCAQTLDRVYIYPSDLTYTLSVSRLIRSGYREQGLWSNLIFSGKSNCYYSRCYLHIEEILLKKELLDLTIELSKLISEYRVSSIIDNIIDSNIGCLDKIWPFPCFECNPVLLSGIGSSNCYKFWVDEEDLKSNFSHIYNRIIYTYESILPLLVSLFRKLSALVEEKI